MKQIHVDEAGTSRKDRKAVVAGVIIDGDRDFRAAEERIALAIEEHIPEHIRPGYVFHAKEVFGKHKRSEGWDISKCNEIIEAWLQIIVDLRIPYVVTWFEKIPEDDVGRFTHASNVIAHAGTFALCLQQCDDYIAAVCPDQVASVVAEDCAHMRKIIQKVSRELLAGNIQSDLSHRKISHIKNLPQFCEKHDAILLQLADACAFSFKRYITSSPGGDRLFATMRGKPEWDIHQAFPLTPAGSLITVWEPGIPHAFSFAHYQPPIADLRARWDEVFPNGCKIG